MYVVWYNRLNEPVEQFLPHKKEFVLSLFPLIFVSVGKARTDVTKVQKKAKLIK